MKNLTLFYPNNVYSCLDEKSTRAELGRLPLRHHIIVAMLKYQFRYLIMNDNELISQVFLSQAKLTRNASNTMTYTQVCQSLKTYLGVNEGSSDINNTVLIHNIKRYGDQIKMKSLNNLKWYMVFVSN